MLKSGEIIMKNKKNENLNYKKIIRNLKIVTILCFSMFLFSYFIGVFLADSNFLFPLIITGGLTTLFLHEYLDIKKHGYERYKKKWYFVGEI